MGDDAGSCISLLRYRAEFGIQDQGGWTELHHVCEGLYSEGWGLYEIYKKHSFLATEKVLFYKGSNIEINSTDQKTRICYLP